MGGRRRAEVRFRDTNMAHEATMATMKQASEDVQRCMRKQRQWMRVVDEQVLATEISKVQYSVRLDKAQKRIDSLSGELSQAYGNVVGLLDERLRAEDMRARNEALTAYLNCLGVADDKNREFFSENRKELKELLQCTRVCRDLRDRLEVVEDQCQIKHGVLGDILNYCTWVKKSHQQLQTAWNNVPASLKEQVFFKAPNSKSSRAVGATKASHPVNSMSMIFQAIFEMTQVASQLRSSIEKVVTIREDDQCTFSVSLHPKD